ncbi:MAG: invasin domain 3-containing protein, partial [Gammaproteobacteria bacterium]
MLSNRFSLLIRLFAVISLSYFIVSCGQGDGPPPVSAEPCPADGVVSFDADSYPESATSAQIFVTDTCVGRKEVVVIVENGTDTIGIDLSIVDGEGSSALTFGDTDDAGNTIAIKEGDVLTVTYTDANGVARSDTADITASTALSTLGVYSETNINPELNVAKIINNDALTNRFSQAVSALEGDYSLQADFALPAVGNTNGLAFTFFGLTNPAFEADNASAGNLEGATGWTTFEFAFTNNTAGPGFGPVSHDAGGFQSLTMYGPFTFDSATGAYQPDNNVVAGESYTATAHVMNWAPDPLAADNLGIFQLTFWDAPGGQAGSGTQIGPAFELLVDSTDDGTNIYLPPQDGAEISDWTELTITQTAPAGAVSAEIFLLHIQLNSDPNNQAGSIFWDDVSLAGVKDLSTSGEDISTYETLKFGINTSAASGLADLEVKMEDNTGATDSVFISNYTGLVVGDWAVYEIPLTDFSGLDQTRMISLGFYNASSTVTGSTSVAPTLLAATLYFDDVHFTKPDTAPVLTGVLVNSPIEGVTFQTATQSGITNAGGEFQYIDGESVTFSVGGIVLGTVQGAAIITPVELTGGADPIDQAAINQLVFLQTIDADSDHTNGITISATTQAAAESQILVFTEPDFSNQVDAVVAAIQDPADPDQSLVDETTALDNFYITYVQLGGTDTFTWSFPPQYPAFPPVVSGANTTIDAVPASVLADGVASSTITVQAKDTSGNNITSSAGVVLLFTTGSASLSAVTDNNDGTYTATVTNTVAEAVTISGSIAGNTITDTAIVTFTASSAPETLGVYSETNTPVLNSVIINAADFGGNSTIPDENSTTVT